MEITKGQINFLMAKLRGSRISEVWYEGDDINMGIDDVRGFRVGVATFTPDEIENFFEQHTDDEDVPTSEAVTEVAPAAPAPTEPKREYTLTYRLNEQNKQNWFNTKDEAEAFKKSVEVEGATNAELHKLHAGHGHYKDHVTDVDGEWQCVCGNEPASDGFYPTDINGNELEPVVGGEWVNLYTCNRCGRVINQDTLEVVNMVEGVKFID